MEPLNPTPSLLCKLGSLAVHMEEMFSDGHAFDRIAVEALLGDDEIKQWLDEMNQLALIPLKRK